MNQPTQIDFAEADGIFIKQIVFGEKDSLVPQHSHTYDHVSMLAVGSVRAWKDGVLLGEFKAPRSIHIDAGTKHLFQTLEPNTIIYCIHNVSRTGIPEVMEEHQIVSEECPSA